MGTANLCYERNGSMLLRADTRSYAQGIEGLRVDRFGEIALLMVHLQHGFGHGNLHDGVVSLRRTHRYLAHT